MTFEKDFVAKLKDEQKKAKEQGEVNRRFEHRQQTERKSVLGRWNWFNSGADSYLANFVDILPFPSTKGYIQGLKEVHSDILGVDIMGQGPATREVGCDSTVALTIDSIREEFDQELQDILSDLNISITFGDALTSETQKEFIENVDTHISSGEKLGIVFFRPVGGMDDYLNFSSTYSLMYLYHHYLRPLYNRLVSGGLIFVDLSYSAGRMYKFGQSSTDLLDRLQQHLDATGLDVVKDESGGTFIIQKSESAPQSLPEHDFESFVTELGLSIEK